jgi:putative nucleotidyltransferase with HDIG domain
VQRHVSDAVQAVNILGLDTIKALVLSVSAFSEFHAPASSSFCIEALWHHSMRVGTTARLIAKAQGESQKFVGDAFTAGMLHDVGKLALATNLPARYEAAIQLAQKKGLMLEEAERQTLGASHAEVGAFLMGLWGLPNDIVEAIAYHHAPPESEGSDAGVFTPLTAVHAANVLVHEAVPADTVGCASTLAMVYLQASGCGDSLPTWRALCYQVCHGDRA